MGLPISLLTKENPNPNLLPPKNRRGFRAHLFVCASPSLMCASQSNTRLSHLSSLPYVRANTWAHLEAKQWAWLFRGDETRRDIAPAAAASARWTARGR
jgi:hypothetical protein